MICRILFLIVISVCFIQKANGQFAQLVQSQQGFVTDTEFDSKGNFYIGGATNVVPLLTKLDQNNNILWVKNYQFLDEDDIIKKITVDSSGVVAFGCSRDSQSNGNWLMKTDTNGNVLWLNDSLNGYELGSFNANYLTIIDSTIHFLNNIRNSSTVTYSYVTYEKYDLHTGQNISIDTILRQDTLSLPFFGNQSPALIEENKWVFSNENYIAEVDTAGSIQYTVLGDSLPGQLIGSIDDQYYSFQNVLKGQIGYYRLFETEIHTFDSSWNYQQSINLFDENMLTHSDSIAQRTNSVLIDSEKGAILSGTYVWTNGQGVFNPPFREGYIMQVDHRTGEVIRYDTNITQTFVSDEISQFGDKILIVGSTSALGEYEIYKINAPTLPALSVGQSKSAESFSVYPNPSSTNFTIQSGKAVKQVNVYNMNGQLIKDLQMRGVHKTNVSIENSGIYIIKVIYENGEFETGKIIKK